MTPISTFVILVKFRVLRTNLPLQGNKLGISKNGYWGWGPASSVRIETPAILDIFQYRPQTSDFSIVYNLSLPAMWSGYVIVFRGCFRNRGCFRIAAVLRTTVPVPKWFVKQPRFWNRGCSNDGISPTKPLVRPRHSMQTWHRTTQSTLWVRNFVDKYRHVPAQLEDSCRLKFRCTWVL
jgi:hypothetical protein